MTSSTTVPKPNGVHLEAILEARDAMTAAPEAAAFVWRARNRWVDGTHSTTTFRGFFGAGAEQEHRETFRAEADHPELFASEDHGPTPVEWVLHALAACLTAGVASVAANRGVEIQEVACAVEGDMDLHGILGIDPDVRNGFSAVRVSFDIAGGADEAEFRSIVRQATRRSAVYDVLSHGVDVHVDVPGRGRTDRSA